MQVAGTAANMWLNSVDTMQVAGTAANMWLHSVDTMQVAGTAANGKTIPLQAWTGPEGSGRLRLPDFNKICI
jgi:hypothetical protein